MSGAGQSDGVQPGAASTGAASSAELAGQLAELTAVTGGLAHEIRNPLSTLRVNLQLLGEDWREIASGKVEASADVASVARRSVQRIDTLVKEVDRLAQLMDNFVRFVGRHELSIVPTDLNSVVGDLADLFEAEAGRTGVRLEFVPAAAALLAPVDINLLKQALLNLLINAMQSMPQGGSLTLRCAAEHDEAIIEVRDTGAGIPPDALPRVFEPYFSTRKGGTGLGLPVARRIINRHGGRLTVETEVGRGTCFRVALPAALPT